MQDISDERQEKAFITMRNKTLLFLSICACFVFSACKKKVRPESIPTGPVNLTIDLNLPSNSHLIGVGTYGYYLGGVKGVMVVHDFDDQWYAFERTCAWQPLTECSKIWGDSLNLNIRCGTFSASTFTPCCESSFSFNGFPSKGPAFGNLAQYQIQKSANLLYVYN